jgi:hypothetical protein
VAWNYFVGIQHFPHSHGDEASLLDIPYRWIHYGDIRFPVFWSQSFGSGSVRISPPVAAFTLRNLYHSLVGLTPVQSRIFSALLFFSMALSVPLFLGRAGLGPWQRVLVLSQVALAPNVLLCARSMRTEQEILVAGWIGAVVLPCIVPALTARWARALCWCGSGLFLGLAGASHPLGLAYGVTGLWLLATTRWWHALDGFRLWQRLAFLALGMSVVAVPTFYQMTNEEARGSVTHITELYQTREQQLTPYLASQPPWNCLEGLLPVGVVARFNVVHAAAYADFFEYPVPVYPLRVVLMTFFYGQLFLVLGYFLVSVCRRFENANPWVHLVVLLAVAFLVVNLCFFPVFTYAVYSTYYISLAAGVVLWRLVANWRPTLPKLRLARGAVAVLCLSASALFVHYGVLHARLVTSAVVHSAFPSVSLDQEFAALDAVSHHLDLKSDDKVVYTSTESWVASGKTNESLWESIMLGLVEPRPDAAGAAFKNAHLEFFLGTFGADTHCKFPSRQARLERLDKFLSPLQLSGLILSEWEHEGAYCFYTRGTSQSGKLFVAHMRRSLQIDYQEAVLQDDIEHPDGFSLEPGQYVLCVWLETDSRGAVLEVKCHPGNAKPIRLSTGSLFTVVPAPVFLEVAESTQNIFLDCRSKERIIPIHRVQIYRLEQAKRPCGGS